MLYDIGRKVSYVVYESSPVEVKGGIAQNAVSGTCLECDKQFMQVTVRQRGYCLNASRSIYVGKHPMPNGPKLDLSKALRSPMNHIPQPLLLEGGGPKYN